MFGQERDYTEPLRGSRRTIAVESKSPAAQLGRVLAGGFCFGNFNPSLLQMKTSARIEDSEKL